MESNNTEYEALVCPNDYSHAISPQDLICLICKAEIVAIDESEITNG
jgi:hypothetical protein